MDELNQGPHKIDWGLGKDAVAEVEDVARAPGSVFENPPGLALDFVRSGQEDDGIQVSLNGDLWTKAFPGPGEINAPVQSDD
jgi:hypothetical protein